MTYAEKLKDPRWQRKRLEILNRDGFACLDCGNKEETLHVHHCLYIYGNEPWEYKDDAYRTLCVSCHQIRGDIEKDVVFEFKRALARKTWNEISMVMMDILNGRTP